MIFEGKIKCELGRRTVKLPDMSEETKQLNNIKNTLKLDEVIIQKLEHHIETLSDAFKSLKIKDNFLDLVINPDNSETKSEQLKSVPKA